MARKQRIIPLVHMAKPAAVAKTALERFQHVSDELTLGDETTTALVAMLRLAFDAIMTSAVSEAAASGAAEIAVQQNHVETGVASFATGELIKHALSEI